MNAIVDNRARRVGEVLRQHIVAGSRLSVVSAYFTVYAYEALRGALEKVAHMRFLYGEPRGVSSVDPAGDEGRAFRLAEDGGMDLKQVLAQRPLARACAAWIRRCVDIRTVRQANFLHGKLYHIAAPGGSAALAGSSNFTRRGLGFGAAPNIELNLEIGSEREREALLAWFDGLWADDSLTRDAKADVLEALERLGAAYAPEFVYYKTLFHIFQDWLAERGRRDGLLHDVHLYDTHIWKRLYSFQRDGATSAINRLLRHNGCIVADSVGLGKTWTALAVIKFFELRNERVLVLCPKKLQENWTRYTSWAAQRNNPFEKDRLNYTVLAHTDLSRESGRAGQIDLARFNWSAFDLVVIDESHNFRNEGSDRFEEEGRIVRRSRYRRLLEEVIKDGVATKVLMLSATPVNTSLRDLRNQIYLMTEKRRDAFREALGIADIQHVFGVAQRAFLEWEKQRKRNGGGKPGKDALIESLGAEFLTVLDAVTIARSRVHLGRFYPEIAEKIGGFPERARPVNLHPPSDRDGAISYDDLHARIGTFRLAVYKPSQYLRDPSRLKAGKEAQGFDQLDRERFLVAMMRVNLLKRLESSVQAFALTMGRILDKMEALECRLAAWHEAGRDQEEGDDVGDTRPDADDEDEEFSVGRSVRYRFAELDIDCWRRDLAADREMFAALKRQAEQVTPQRDAKLAALRDLLAKKAAHPTRDKDGRENRKVLVFTAFADTARYLYRQVRESQPEASPKASVALVTGGGGNDSSVGSSDAVDILARFAPRAQEREESGGEIDILIATDCLSEGQNLQDCDLVVNYDIHWNPVKLMQRFGRIDRLGSRNRQVAMTNFWPTQELERYLDLRNRVEARMALADAAATGLDDPLDREQGEEAAQRELAFRNRQLKRLRDEILDSEQAEDGVAMSDLTLDDFVADLLRYVETNRAALEAAPFGIYAVAAGPHPGAVFCLRHKDGPSERAVNPLQPWFLVHVRADGGVRYGFQQARQCLTLFRQLAVGHSAPDHALEAAFDRETEQGRRMERYDRLLEAALDDIAAAFRRAERRRIGQDRGARLSRATQRPEGSERFELATWLAIAPRPANS